MAKHKKKLPDEFASIEAAQEFWDSQSSADYWDSMEDVDMQLSPALQAQLEAKKLYCLLGLSPQQIAVIKQEAKHRHIDTKRLISHWVVEYIRDIRPASG
ncbi:MAG: hypothetical protein D3904_11815 [Candidatus Electrothrix sp. EH2]|nr:hypothetical protein [Candidatus Electrothrix sp. EH2]